MSCNNAAPRCCRADLHMKALLPRASEEKQLTSFKTNMNLVADIGQGDKMLTELVTNTY